MDAFTVTASSARNVISGKELSECDREKLHLLGHIQGDSGHAIFVTYPQGRIIAADAKIQDVPWVLHRDASIQNADGTGSSSDNSSDVKCGAGLTNVSTNLSCQELIGSSLQDWIPSLLYHDIVEAVDGMQRARSQRTFRFFLHKNKSYAVSVSRAKADFALLCIEIEFTEHIEAEGDFYNTLVSLGRIMELYADERIVHSACDTVFRLLGSYDRGMVYQFNDDLSGEVVHEIKKDDIKTSYMGMRFPASDIPLPARELYIKNGLRYIENVDADDLPIISENNQEIDLTHCRMRAVAKPHLIYLRNMGVVSSMSIAIVVENELWGLLAFHGYSKPFKPSLHQRIACETINSMVSVKVETITKKAQSARIIELSGTLMKWDPNFSVTDNLSKIGKELLHVLDADVLVGRIEEPGREEADCVVIGDGTLVPGRAFWENFSARPSKEIYAVNTRAAIASVGLTEADCPASGVAYFQEREVQIMVGRGLRSKDVVWAGNPDEPKLRIGGILNPRHSFEIFMEKAKKESRAWSTSDIDIISALMDRVTEHSHNCTMKVLKSGIEEANQKYFNAISRSKENCEFIAQMSHEIRTPFHGVMGCLNILNDTMDDMSEEEVEDIINTALSSGNHMISLLNDILSLSKNKFSEGLAKDKIRLQTLAHESVRGLQSLALSNNITFDCSVIPEESYKVIETDKAKVEQIISNIVSNAIKFAAGGTVKVELTIMESMKASVEQWAEVAKGYAGSVFTMEENELFDSVDAVKTRVSRLPEDTGQKWMVVSVADSGCGMRANELAEMLKPYTQSSRGSNRVFQGTGLGLFICVSLCQQMGGFFACSSTSLIGTVFHVGVPITFVEGFPVEEIEPFESLTTISPPTGPIPIRGPIVVCDDNVVNVKILKRGLELDLKHFGIDREIFTVEGGAGLIALYKKLLPSLVFIDYHMPDIDGAKATKQIRQYEKENGLIPAYIIIYTADLTDEANEILNACGMNEIMSKPPPKGYISAVVQRMRVEGSDSLE